MMQLAAYLYKWSYAFSYNSTKNTKNIKKLPQRVVYLSLSATLTNLNYHHDHREHTLLDQSPSMAATRDAAPEVRKSVEAEPDDIQMKDAQSADDHSEDDVDADGEPDDEAEGEGSRDLRDMIRELSEYLCNLEEE